MKVEEWENGCRFGTGFHPAAMYNDIFFSFVLADQADKPNDEINVCLTCLSASLSALWKKECDKRKSGQDNDVILLYI